MREASFVLLLDDKLKLELSLAATHGQTNLACPTKSPSTVGASTALHPSPRYGTQLPPVAQVPLEYNHNDEEPPGRYTDELA